jgi:PAS domain S-box-containing protein
VNSKLTLARKGLLLIAVPFSIQLFLTLAYAGLIERAEHFAEFEYRSKAVISGANWMMVLLSVATNSAFAYGSTKEEDYRKIGKTCLDKTANQERELVAYMPTNQSAFNDLFVAASSVKGAIEKSLAKAGSSRNNDFSALLSPETKAAWSRLFDARTNLFSNERNAVSVGPSDLPATRKTLRGFLFAGVVLDIAFGIFLMRVYNVSIAKRLAVLRDNTVRLSKGEELNKPEQGEDEISELSQNFHNMAQELTVSKRELEVSEQRLKNLIENLPVGFVTVDSDGTIKAVNARTIEMFGDDCGQIVGQGIETLISQAAKEQLFVQDEAGNSGLVPVQTEIETTSPRGRQMFLELTLKENQFRDETIKLMAIQDITQRRAIEQLREEFLKMVSHDIRSPLTAIHLTNELLLAGAYGGLPERAKEKVVRSEKNSARLLQLINDLLDYEKLRSGTLELKVSLFDSASFIKNSFEAVQDLADKKNVGLVGAMLSVQVNGDEARLMQVIVNLLSNAIKFSPPDNQVTVEVNARDLFVEFQVQDNGRGIPSEYQQVIFEKYKQVQQDDFSEKKGTGLGLPICKLIVEQHGGTIGVKSEPGKGSTFWFRLPSKSKLSDSTESDRNT